MPSTNSNLAVDVVSDGIRLKVREITPQMAEIFLRSNETNRKLRPNKVTQWATAMMRGEWTLNPDCIAFDVNGRLINGQHRLHAVIKAGTPQPFIILEGLAPEVQKHMDVGQKRMLADHLHMARGESDAHLLASVLATLHRWQRGLSLDQGGVGMPSTEEAEQLFDGDADAIRKAVLVGRTAARAVRTLNPTSLAVTHYFFSAISPDEAEVFMDRLTTGVGFDQTGDPILALRELCINYGMRRIAVSNSWRIAVIIKTWNAWRENREVKTMRWASSEKMPVPV